MFQMTLQRDIFEKKKKHSRYLFGRQDGHVVFVYDPGLVIHHRGVRLLLQLLAGQPEKQVVLAVLRAQELPEHLPALQRAQHHLEAPRPRQRLLQARVSAVGENAHVCETDTNTIVLAQTRLEGRRLDLLFFCSFNTVHLGAGLSFTPLHPVFIPGSDTRSDV